MLEKFLVFFNNTRNSLNNCHVKLNWLLSYLLISKISLANNVHCVFKDLLKLRLKELWLNFCDLIELNPSILEHDLVIFLICHHDDVVHIWDQFNELLGVCLFYRLKVITHSLKGGKSDVKTGMVQCLSENAEKVLFELVQVINDVREKTVEDLKSCIDKQIVV